MLESDQHEANIYAEMVCLGRESIAETGTMQVGWPNYKGITVDCDLDRISTGKKKPLFKGAQSRGNT